MQVPKLVQTVTSILAPVESDGSSDAAPPSKLSSKDSVYFSTNNELRTLHGTIILENHLEYHPVLAKGNQMQKVPLSLLYHLIYP